jgi:hypothetical protein
VQVVVIQVLRLRVAQETRQITLVAGDRVAVAVVVVEYPQPLPHMLVALVDRALQIPTAMVAL